LKVGIVLFDEVDLLDAGGPYEVFLTASRLTVREGSSPPFEVITVGRDREPVVAYGGLQLIPHLSIDEARDLDLLVVPGAVAIDKVIGDAKLMDKLRHAVKNTPVVSSVCTGAFILGELDLLEGRPWTTHWEDVESLATRVNGSGQPWVKWIDSGDVVTSGGLSSGIAMALHIVDRFGGRDLAVRTARQLEYVWNPKGGTERITR
jgi:transcriptional regulator GlxA family with amidase domain